MPNLKNIDKIKELTKELSILYVEDEESVRQPVTEILNNFFKKIIVAKDGLEGLDLYSKYMDEIDFIISDINMLNMNGLDMIEQIRQKNQEIPVVISTAYNEQNYFLKSIELKINKYLLKPLKQNNLIEMIRDISMEINDKKTLKELLKNKRKIELKEKEMNTVSMISGAYASPAVIFHNGKATHFSEPFIKLFKDRKDISLIDIYIDTENIFKKQKGCLKSFAKYDDKNKLNNKVTIPQKIGHRVFRVHKKSINLDGKSDIFTLIDITIEEYQKIKIDSFAEALTDMVIEHKSQKILQEPKTIKEDLILLEEGSLIVIKDDMKTLLRKNHKKNAISSTEFLSRIDKEDLKDLQELDDLDKDLFDAVSELEDGDFNQLQKISSYISQYADAIYHLEDFTDLYIVIKDLSNLLTSIDSQSIESSKYTTFFLYLNSIREDLASWRRNVFIEQNTQDIHYLDSSLINTSLEIEILLSNKQDTSTLEDDGSDLEFF